jgi:uroporphyrinogen decarboxylase
MNKREQVLSLLDENKKQDYIPAGFFLHFDPIYQQGQAAVDKHLEFFRYTDMDFVKIQYETIFPRIPEIKTPDDWDKMPLYKHEFYDNQLSIVDGLVRAAQGEALVIMTLYSPFMCAAHATSYDMITDHMKEAPEKIIKGMEIVTDSLMLFVKECIDRGVDGFYMSTQGGESHRFGDPVIFKQCVKPFDLALMDEINRNCIFNILHVCDFLGGYSDFDMFLDYPGHVVNCNPELESGALTGQEISRMFGRPYMGGLDRKGIITTGGEAEITEVVLDILKEAPEKFILAADCTLPSDINWNNIRTAIATAHDFRRENT